MTIDELGDEAVAVLTGLERLGCHLEADAGGLHVFTAPDVTDLGDLGIRLDGVLAAVVAVVSAEQYLRKVAR